MYGAKMERLECRYICQPVSIIYTSVRKTSDHTTRRARSKKRKTCLKKLPIPELLTRKLLFKLPELFLQLCPLKPVNPVICRLRDNLVFRIKTKAKKIAVA